jgi:tight adherence protein B
MLATLALLIFVSLVLAGYAVTTMLGARQEARAALQRRIATMTGMSDGRLHVGVLKDRRLSAISALNTLLPRFGSVTPLAAMIVRAGLKKRVGEVLLYIVLVAFAGTLLVTLATGKLLLGIMAGALTGAVPLLVVRRMARRRSALFSDQLPDALDLMRAALQAGHGLMAAMSVVAEEFPDPVAQEFRDVTEEVRLGRPLREALDSLAERVGNPDLALLEVGILIAQEIGGNLAEVLDKISHTIRERFEIERDIKVLTAQGRLSSSLITALPFLVGGAMMILNPDYLAPILQTKMGWYMLTYAAVSLLAGHFMIRRIVRIEV